ncbi:MAG TPA: sulfatase-like hydrolase/transferase, partial [Polyangiaceae bacterium]|nr:sulfatase-like hydrolase/transferase [Polyangiaceae bacterium]
AVTVVCWLTGLGLLAQKFRHRWRVQLAVLIPVALLWPFVVVGTLQYRKILGSDPPPSMAMLLIRNPRYGLATMSASVETQHVLGIVAVPFLLCFGLWYLVRNGHWLPPPPLMQRLGFVLALSVALWANFRGGLRVPPDVQGLAVLAGGTLLRVFDGRYLEKPRRVPVAAAPMARERPDIYLLIHESVSPSMWRPWTTNPDASPLLADFLAAHSRCGTWFPETVAASSSTHVSVPSILTGLNADAPKADYLTAPVLWQEARTLGYTTALLSTQSFNEEGFPQFFLQVDLPNDHKVANDFPNARKTVDNGVADEAGVDAAMHIIVQAPRDQPLLMVLQFNGTHEPCVDPTETQTPSFIHDWSVINRRCERAAQHLVGLMAQLFRHIEKTRSLNRAVVIGTSDHAEPGFRPGRPTRVESYYEEALRVPMFAVLPDNLCAAHPEWRNALQTNRTLRTSNMDIYPTILDIWGRWPLSPGRPRMGGSSLLGPIAPDRPLVAANSTEIRAWSREGFALYHGRYKWLVDWKGVSLFDLASDADERSSIAANAPPSETAFLKQELANRPPLLRRILDQSLAASRSARTTLF